jgi:sulfur-carrier protein
MWVAAQAVLKAPVRAARTVRSAKTVRKGGIVTVWVVVPNTLTGDAGGRREIELDLSDAFAAVTVTEVLDQLRTELPALERRLRDERSVIRKHVNVYVGGLDIRSLAGLETPVTDGALVQIMAAASGG